MAAMSNGNKGACGELTATVWLLRQGYDVFRNVSPHGPIDLVAVKDGKAEYFDVKTARRMQDGSPSYPKLSQEQKALGVRCICVFDDGNCEIDETRLFDGDSVSLVCEGCGNAFERGQSYRQRFCSKPCGFKNYKMRIQAGSPKAGLI